MSKKDFNRGVDAAIKANTAFMHKQAEATAELGKRIIQKIDDQGKIIEVILDRLNDQEKKELYDLQSEYDIADLGQNEKEVLASYLLTLIAKYGQDTEEQKSYYFAVKNHLKVTDVSENLNLALVENIDSRSEAKAMFQTVCEFLFLKTGNTSFLDTFESELEHFDLTNKAIRETVVSIEKIYNILGLRGIVEHYIPAEIEEESAEEEETYLILDWKENKDFCLQNGLKIEYEEYAAIPTSQTNIIFKNFPKIKTSWGDSINFNNCKFENCEYVSLDASTVENCVFESCDFVGLDCCSGEDVVFVSDCVFSHVPEFLLTSAKIVRSRFENIEYSDEEAAIAIQNSTTITDSVFDNIRLTNDSYLFIGYDYCNVKKCAFNNVFTDRSDMDLGYCERTDGKGIFKTTHKFGVIDEQTCSGLDMINVIQ